MPDWTPAHLVNIGSSATRLHPFRLGWKKKRKLNCDFFEVVIKVFGIAERGKGPGWKLQKKKLICDFFEVVIDIFRLLKSGGGWGRPAAVLEPATSLPMESIATD